MDIQKYNNNDNKKGAHMFPSLMIFSGCMLKFEHAFFICEFWISHPFHSHQYYMRDDSKLQLRKEE